MALDGTYAGLQASAADFLDRADLTAVIPDFIRIAESQFARRIAKWVETNGNIPRRLVDTDAPAFALDAVTAGCPADMVGPLELLLTGADAAIIDMDYLDLANFKKEVAKACWAGAPKFYTVIGSAIHIFPAADQAYTGELTYISRLPALSADNQADNWILQDYPDAYLYGALTASAPYLSEDARIGVWGGLFTSAIDDICNSDPMPTSKALLRTEVSPQMIGSHRYGYDINSDS